MKFAKWKRNVVLTDEERHEVQLQETTEETETATSVLLTLVSVRHQKYCIDLTYC